MPIFTKFLFKGENAALASVGAAAVTAGYHVTLEPSASAPPVVVGLQQNNNEPSTVGQHVSSSPAGSLTSSVSLPVSCAATTEGEGRGGSQQEGEQQKSQQQQRCSPPPGFGNDFSNNKICFGLSVRK